jgi:hypothetical protein
MRIACLSYDCSPALEKQGKNSVVNSCNNYSTVIMTTTRNFADRIRPLLSFSIWYLTSLFSNCLLTQSSEGFWYQTMV